MGFSFNFFGKQEVRKFNYRPRFYDPEVEERRAKYGDFTKPKEEGKYVPGSIVKGSLRDGNYQRKKEVSKNQKVIGAVSLILLFAVVFLMYKYFPLLIDSLGK
jgi:CRISPR/Cas system CSM-associated protein Csm5 (group 7 of RAMP superfamily)